MALKVMESVRRNAVLKPDLPFADLGPHTLLTAAEVAQWLKISPRQVQRLQVPWIDLGRKTRRYEVGEILTWLQTKRRS